MLVLFETPAGHALFKAKKGKLKEVDMFEKFKTPELAAEQVQLKAFGKFDTTTDALAATTAAVEGKLSKSLKSFLKTNIVQKDIETELAVADAKIGKIVQEKLGIKCVTGKAVEELLRGIRFQITNLIQGLKQEDMNAMALGLSHSLSRYKLKFSPDKVDTMIVQAVSLLDDLDKELNTYAMRVREWYGWHFPECSKLVSENLAYARMVLKAGSKDKFVNTDFSDILPEEVEEEVKEAAEISMGFEISEEDLLNIKSLCTQVVDISAYRAELYEYLKNRMNAIAPGLTLMVGELVGARLIAHAGSLLNLAKQPASTVQILGAEKALFRALKTKHDTPKYGLLYHASVVGQSAPKNKGKMSRVLAAKTSLVARVDALGDAPNPEMAIICKEKVEQRLRQLEGLQSHVAVKSNGAKQDIPKYEAPAVVQSYNDAGDSTMDTSSDKKKKKKRKKDSDDDEEDAQTEEAPKKKKKKDKSMKKDKKDKSMKKKKKKKSEE